MYIILPLFMGSLWQHSDFFLVWSFKLNKLTCHQLSYYCMVFHVIETIFKTITYLFFKGTFKKKTSCYRYKKTKKKSRLGFDNFYLSSNLYFVFKIYFQKYKWIKISSSGFIFHNLKSFRKPLLVIDGELQNITIDVM